MAVIKTINVATANQWLSDNEAVIVDVREPGEYQMMHIEGAKLLPVGSITCEQLPALNGKKLIIHCLHGKRGGIACEKLLASQPGLEVYNLEGGITAWMDQGFKVTK